MMRKSWLILVFGVMAALSQAWAQGSEAGPTFKRLSERGIIFLGHSEASFPFSYVLADRSTPAGYSWEICQRVVQQIESRIGRKLAVVPVVTTPNSRFLAVKAGMADLECGASTNTMARQKLVDFSNTFFVAEVKLLVRADSGIKSLADLDRKRVVTTSGTTADRLVKIAALQRSLAVEHIMGRSHLESMALLEAGKADAFVADDAILAGRRVASKQAANYVLVDESLSLEPYGLTMRKGDPGFKALVDATLAEMMKSGEMAALYDKWFMQPIPPNGLNLGLPLSEMNKRAFANPGDRPAN